MSRLHYFIVPHSFNHRWWQLRICLQLQQLKFSSLLNVQRLSIGEVRNFLAQLIFEHLDAVGIIQVAQRHAVYTRLPSSISIRIRH
jgi:hypothetical protein